jgi:hypothetical protein
MTGDFVGIRFAGNYASVIFSRIAENRASAMIGDTLFPIMRKECQMVG